MHPAAGMHGVRFRIVLLLSFATVLCEGVPENCGFYELRMELSQRIQNAVQFRQKWRKPCAQTNIIARWSPPPTSTSHLPTLGVKPPGDTHGPDGIDYLHTAMTFQPVTYRPSV